MKTYKRHFTATMTPVIKQTAPESNLSTVGAEFANESSYILNGIIHTGGLGGIIHTAGSTENEIYAEMIITNEEGTLDWKLVTLPTTSNGSTLWLEIDPRQSFLNGASNLGTLKLTINPDATFSYFFDAYLTSNPSNMPMNAGGERLNIVLNLYVNGVIAISQDFKNGLLDTFFIGDAEDVPEFVIDFSDHAFVGNITVNHFTLPLAAKSLSGLIAFKNDQIAADMRIDAFVDAYGNIVGVIAPPYSNINEAAVRSYIIGHWGCDQLTLAIDLGAVLASCGYEIPTYAVDIHGILTLKVK